MCLDSVGMWGLQRFTQCHPEASARCVWQGWGMRGDRHGVSVEAVSSMMKERSYLGLPAPLAVGWPQLRVILGKGPLSAAPRERLAGQRGPGGRPGAQCAWVIELLGHSRPGLQYSLIPMCLGYTGYTLFIACLGHRAPGVPFTLITTCFSYRLLRPGTSWSEGTWVTPWLGHSAPWSPCDLVPACWHRAPLTWSSFVMAPMCFGRMISWPQLSFSCRYLCGWGSAALGYCGPLSPCTWVRVSSMPWPLVTRWSPCTWVTVCPNHSSSASQHNVATMWLLFAK